MTKADEKLALAIERAVALLKEDGGPLEDGEQAVFVLNDAAFVLGKDDGTLSLNIVLGKPYFIDMNVCD